MTKLFVLYYLICVLTLPVLGRHVNKTQDCEAKSLVHDGLKRTYLIYVPHSIDHTNNIALLIALHGGLGSGKRMAQLTQGGFNELSEKENFIVVYPDGIDHNWNDGRLNMPSSYKAHNQRIDDVGFIHDLIDILIKENKIDPARVYVTGISNGAMMAHRLAIELSDKIAAAVPVCGNLPSDLVSKPNHRVAMMMINGTADPLVPYEGGDVHFKKRQLGKVLSVDATVKYWVMNNRISPEPQILLLPDGHAEDGCKVKKFSYGSSVDDGEVVLLKFEGGGHTWPGGFQYFNEKVIGKTCRYVNACQLIWDFCKAHSKH